MWQCLGLCGIVLAHVALLNPCDVILAHAALIIPCDVLVVVDSTDVSVMKTLRKSSRVEGTGAAAWWARQKSSLVRNHKRS